LLLASIEAGGDEFPMNFYSPALVFALIHRSGWNRNSRKFALKVFCELRIDGVLGNWSSKDMEIDGDEGTK
jgi:hypothetical protein